MRLREYSADIFGNWRAMRVDKSKRPSEWQELETFVFDEKMAVAAVQAELARRHGLSPEDIFVYNTEDEPEMDMEEGVLNKINGGKRRKRRKVNISQREI